MRYGHPNRKRREFVAILVVLIGSAGGCRNQPTTASLGNPFLAPDRVPPPATRVIQPGTAQPYYPGDPLPAMQSGTTPPAPFLAAATGTPPPSPTASPSAAAAPTFVASGERRVTVPVDQDELRFAAPPPSLPPALTDAQPPTPQPSLAVTAPGPPPPVAPAVYSQPVSNVAPSPIVEPTLWNAAPTDPWRPPQIVLPGATPVRPSGTQIQGPASIDVQLRAVPSPEPVPNNTPRIRMPSGGASSAQPVAGPADVQQAMFYAPMIPPGAVVQTVRTTELPPLGPYGINQSAFPPAAPDSPPQSVASQAASGLTSTADGFRARGTSR